MNVKDKIADAKKREEEENKINRQIISNAIVDLLSNFKYTYGSIKKTKSGGYLELFVKTGFWSENEKAVKKFNSTRFKGATMKWWLRVVNDRERSYEWDIPLFLVDEAILEALKK